MAVTLEELEQRLTRLEQAFAHFREKEETPGRPLTPAERGAEAIRRARESQPEISAAWEELVKLWDLPREPLSIEELHASMIASGINPNDNEFSRGIIEMREE